jgi:hypothetical protein
MGLDTKTYLLTDCQSQCDFDFVNLILQVGVSFESDKYGHEPRGTWT